MERIIQQGLEINKGRVFIPSGTQLSSSSDSGRFQPTFIGFQSKQLIVEAGLGLGDVDEHPTIDVTLDGADEQVAFSCFFHKTLLTSPSCRVDHQLNCVKGGGACHLREKVLAEAANTCVSFFSLFYVKISPTEYISQVSSSSQIIAKTSSTLGPMYLFPLKYLSKFIDFRNA